MGSDLQLLQGCSIRKDSLVLFRIPIQNDSTEFTYEVPLHLEIKQNFLDSFTKSKETGNTDQNNGSRTKEDLLGS